MKTHHTELAPQNIQLYIYIKKYKSGITNLKQLTYRVSGTFKFNKSNFIIAMRKTPRDTHRTAAAAAAAAGSGRARPQNEQSGLFFYFISFPTIAPSVLCVRPHVPTPSHHLVRILFLFLFFRFISHFLLRPRV